MCPWTSFAGKQILSDITVLDPFSNNPVLEMSERTTLKPHSTRKVHQKGKFSYIFRARGIPNVKIGDLSGSVLRSKSSLDFAAIRFSPCSLKEDSFEK